MSDKERGHERMEEDAKKLQSEIDEHSMKAESSSGDEKDEHINMIRQLKQKKDSLMRESGKLKEKGKGMMNDMGM